MTTAATRRITFSADRLRNVNSTETLDDQAQVPTLNTAVLGAVWSLRQVLSLSIWPQSARLAKIIVTLDD